MPILYMRICFKQGETYMLHLGNIKRGDTFAFYANLTDSTGTPVDIEASKIKCQVRDRRDVLIAELSVTATETEGKYLLTTQHDTEDWPVETLYMDIQITDGDAVNSSETINFIVEKDITHE